MDRVYYGIGLGGTNLSLARVNPKSGEVYQDTLFATSLHEFGGNYGELMSSLTDRIPRDANIGICIAGVVDEYEVALMNSENSPFGNRFNLGYDLHNSLDARVSMVPDGKGESMAVSRWGGYEEGAVVALLTLGTGVGAGYAQNGISLLPLGSEVGHQYTIPLPDRYSIFRDVPCGCSTNDGENGICFETLGSGTGAVKLARRSLASFSPSQLENNLLTQRAIASHNEDLAANGVVVSDLSNSDLRERVLDMVTARDLYETYRENPSQLPQAMVIEAQRYALQKFIPMLNSWYHSDVLAIKGGFIAKNRDILFDDVIVDGDGNIHSDIHAKMLRNYSVPDIVLLEDDALSLKGGVADFLEKDRVSRGRILEHPPF